MLRELRLPEGGFASAQDADTDGVEGLTFTWTPEEGVREELLQPFEHGRSVIRGELERRGARAAVRAPRAAPEAAARRQGDRGVERARRSLRSPKRAGGSSAPTTSTRRARSASSCSARSPTASGCTAPSAPARRKAPATSRTTRTSRTACSSCTWRPASCAGSREANRLARLAVELFADEERGGFFLSPVDGEAARRAQEGSRGPPDAVRQLDARLVLLRLARIYGDDELERRAVGVFRLVHGAAHARAVRVRRMR